MALNALQADELDGVKHGFFTREGGLSAGIYEGLNCGTGSNDDPDHVRQNRALVAAHMGVEDQHLISVHQIHSPDVIAVEAPHSGDKPQCDGMVTRTPGIALGVLSADCAPILFADAQAGVVGAAHSGWKGTQAGIGARTVEAMEALGANRADISAAIGPCISQRAYEVGPEFMDSFIDEDPDHARFFAGGQGDRVQFDLPGFILASLRACGIGRAGWTGHCTYSDAQKFYSYRRTTHAGAPDYGRLISAIRI